MARKIGAQAYIECSALTQENLNKGVLFPSFLVIFIFLFLVLFLFHFYFHSHYYFSAFMTCIAASLGELQISTTKKQSRKGIMAQVKSIFSKPQKPQPPSSAINFQGILLFFPFSFFF